MKKQLIAAGIALAAVAGGCFFGPTSVNDLVSGTLNASGSVSIAPQQPVTVTAPSVAPSATIAMPKVEPTPLEPAEITIRAVESCACNISSGDDMNWVGRFTISNQTSRDLWLAAKSLERIGTATPDMAVLENFSLLADKQLVASVAKTSSSRSITFDPSTSRFEIRAKSTVLCDIRTKANFPLAYRRQLVGTTVGFRSTEQSFEIIGGGTIKGVFPIDTPLQIVG